MLSGRLELGDVRDVKAMCAAVLDRYVRRTGVYLESADAEDKLADLLEWTWRLWRFSFDPARQPSFASYASWKLGMLLHDDTRAKLGRKGRRRDVEIPGFLEELDDAGLEEALASSAGDDVADCALARVELLAGRDREVLRAESEVAEIARSPKGVSQLLRQLRHELGEQAAA